MSGFAEGVADIFDGGWFLVGAAHDEAGDFFCGAFVGVHHLWLSEAVFGVFFCWVVVSGACGAVAAWEVAGVGGAVLVAVGGGGDRAVLFAEVFGGF